MIFFRWLQLVNYYVFFSVRYISINHKYIKGAVADLTFAVPMTVTGIVPQYWNIAMRKCHELSLFISVNELFAICYSLKCYYR